MVIVHTTSLFDSQDPDAVRRMSIARRTWDAVYQDQQGRIVGAHQHVSDAPRSSRSIGDDRNLPYIKDLIAYGFTTQSAVADAVMLTNADTCLIRSRMGDVSLALALHGCYFSFRYEHRRFDAPLTDAVACRAPIYPGADLLAVTRTWWDRHRADYPDMLLGAEAWDGVLKGMMALHGAPLGRPIAYHQCHEPYWSSHALTSRSQIHNRQLARRWIEKHGTEDFLSRPVPSSILLRSVGRQVQTSSDGCRNATVANHVLSSNVLNAPSSRSSEQVLKVPDAVQRLVEQAVALDASGRLTDAERCYRQAIQLCPDQTATWTNLANVLMRMGDPESAMSACRRALDLDGNFRPAYNVLGALHIECGRMDDALAATRKATELGPDHPGSHTNYGMVLLMIGDFAKGWTEHEWRVKLPNPIHSRLGTRWDGSDLFGQTLLVYGDGGIGDVAQFARFIPQLQKRGARVIVECQPELMPLISTVRGVWKVVPRNQPSPHHDAFCSLVSLPAILGATLQTLPSDVPYLHPDVERVKRWRAIVRRIPGCRVGLCWKGDPRSVLLQDRSFDPQQFDDLARIDGVSLISLQYRERPPANSPISILPGLEAETMQLDDVAAVMEHLDLVITCDTGLAHLAGALGRPVWVALKKSACWRWMVGRQDSPWYPTMRLFRQTVKGDWGTVFKSIAAALRKRLSDCARTEPMASMEL